MQLINYALISHLLTSKVYNIFNIFKNIFLETPTTESSICFSASYRLLSCFFGMNLG